MSYTKLTHFQILQQAAWLEPKISGLTPDERNLLITLVSFGDNKGENIFPSYKKLSEKTGWARSTVQKVYKSLMEKQFIILVEEHNRAKRKAKKIKIDVDKLYMKSVDNPVYQSITVPSHGIAPVPSHGIASVPSHGTDQIIINKPLKPDHNDWEKQDDFRNMVLANLLKYNTFKKTANKFIDELGPELVQSKLRELELDFKERGKEPRDRGAYIGKCLSDMVDKKEKRYG